MKRKFVVFLTPKNVLERFYFLFFILRGIEISNFDTFVKYFLSLSLLLLVDLLRSKSMLSKAQVCARNSIQVKVFFIHSI